MKALSPALQAHLDEGTTTLAWCWRTVNWVAPLGPGQTLAIRIFQLSNCLGRGTPAAVTLQF
jgi:hypothetical protein